MLGLIYKYELYIALFSRLYLYSRFNDFIYIKFILMFNGVNCDIKYNIVSIFYYTRFLFLHIGAF